MYSPKQFRGKAAESGDLTMNPDARGHDASAGLAIDAWESEGGGTIAAPGGFDAARTDSADWRADNNVGWLASHSDKRTIKNDDAGAFELADQEDRILRCLGAAVVMRWNTLPTKLQRELFDNASSARELLQTGALKGQIARFLHKHKDDEG